MPQVRRLTAKRSLKLDCGHIVCPGQTFLVTSIFTCEKDRSWPLVILRASFQAAVAKLNQEMQRLGLIPKPSAQR